MTKKSKKIYKGPKYPTEAYGKIPAFHSLEEEANFWDTHAVTDFEDETEDVDLVFELDKKKEKTIVMRIEKEMKRKLERAAKKKRSKCFRTFPDLAI